MLGRKKIRPLALQSKEKYGRNRNLDATEISENTRTDSGR
jgi:hypothetical protein